MNKAKTQILISLRTSLKRPHTLNSQKKEASSYTRTGILFLNISRRMKIMEKRLKVSKIPELMKIQLVKSYLEFWFSFMTKEEEKENLTLTQQDKRCSTNTLS
jgi:hypothetical protein